MGDNLQYTSIFPELNRLYNFPGPSQILGSTTAVQSLLCNPTLFAHQNSSEQSPNSSSSSEVAPKQHSQPRQQKRRPYGILQETSKLIATCAVAPLERVYILMQCQNEMLKYGHLSTPYKGMKDCFLRTVKYEGFFSLWRGNSINVITPLTVMALASTYDHLVRGSRPVSRKEMQEQSLWLTPLFASCGMLFLYPFKYVRTRLATDIKAAQELQFSFNFSGKRHCNNAFGNRMFSGVFDVFKKTLKSDGIIGLYRGCSLACVGFSAYSLASTGIKSHYRTDGPKKENNTALSVWIAPIITVTVLPVAFYPITTVYRRMMMTSGEATKYKNVLHAIGEIVRHEGASSLYKGITPFVLFTLSKQACLLASIYLTYSGVKKLRDKLSSY